jgi:hypothetical protein
VGRSAPLNRATLSAVKNRHRRLKKCRDRKALETSEPFYLRPEHNAPAASVSKTRRGIDCDRCRQYCKDRID